MIGHHFSAPAFNRAEHFGRLSLALEDLRSDAGGIADCDAW
jgi:hypothetical protein